MPRCKHPLNGKPVNLRLPDALNTQVDELALALGEPKSTVLRLALRSGLMTLRRAHVIGG